MASETLDIVYDPEHSLTTDLYLPAGPMIGGIIDIHGGGWFRGDKSRDADWARRLTARGFAVLTPNYRMTPDVHYPAPLEDMDTLMTWIQTNKAGFPKEHLGAVGGSAGGNMAIELALKYGIPAVSLSGIVDMDRWLYDHRDVEATPPAEESFEGRASADINQIGRDDGFYKWFVARYIGDAERTSPYHRTSSRSGPIFLANSLDEFVPYSGVLTLASALANDGVASTVRILPGKRHAKGYLDDVFEESVTFLLSSMPQS